MRLFEFGDQTWLPGALREGEAAYLAASYKMLPLARRSPGLGGAHAGCSRAARPGAHPGPVLGRSGAVRASKIPGSLPYLIGRPRPALMAG